MIFDYETLKIIWWLFVGVLLIGFAVTDSGNSLRCPTHGKYGCESDGHCTKPGISLGGKPF